MIYEEVTNGVPLYRLNMRLPVPLLDGVKATAKARGVPYTRFIREVLERATSAKPDRPRR